MEKQKERAKAAGREKWADMGREPVEVAAS